jgi:hypothetical protein
MKIRHLLIASVALAAGPALAQDTAQAGSDCATLQSQYDQAAATASSEQLSAAKSARADGEKLCAEGNSAEGAAKLQEALDALSQPSQQPSMEQPPTETQPPPQ